MGINRIIPLVLNQGVGENAEPGRLGGEWDEKGIDFEVGLIDLNIAPGIAKQCSGGLRDFFGELDGSLNTPAGESEDVPLVVVERGYCDGPAGYITIVRDRVIQVQAPVQRGVAAFEVEGVTEAEQIQAA